jgi:hypothetical protein
MFERLRKTKRFTCPQCGITCYAFKVGDPNQWKLKHPTGNGCTCPRDAFIAAFNMAVKPEMAFPDVETVWNELVKKEGNPLNSSN